MVPAVYLPPFPVVSWGRVMVFGWMIVIGGRDDAQPLGAILFAQGDIRACMSIYRHDHFSVSLF